MTSSPRFAHAATFALAAVALVACGDADQPQRYRVAPEAQEQEPVAPGPECYVHDDCPQPGACSGGECYPATRCSVKDDCNLSSQCVDTVCRSGCLGPAYCGPGETCNPVTNYCAGLDNPVPPVVSGGSGSGGYAALGGAGGSGSGATGAGATGAGATGAGATGAGATGGTVEPQLPDVTFAPQAGSCPTDLGGYSQGSVTWYTFSQGTALANCSFKELGRSPDRVADVYTGNGTFFGAMNTADYGAAASCGACAEVTRLDTGKSVTVTIVDQCPIATNPKCVSGHIDLSQAAFQQLGSLDEGYLGTGNGGTYGQVSWRYVPCPVPDTQPVTFRLKEPDNRYWNGIIVQSHKLAIRAVSVELTPGNWVAATREDYNFWVPPNGRMGTEPYHVIAQDVAGNEVEGYLLLDGQDYPASSQLVCQ